MIDKKLQRFFHDINYDICISPYGYDYYHMTDKQALDNFEWFLSKIPERMKYLRKRCSDDLNISVEKLDYSADSLILIWRWFLQIAKMEKTPEDILEKMIEGAKFFGDSFVNEKQFTVTTQFIMKDIGAYIGQTYILNHPQLKWSFYTKPKSDINVKQPVIEGFYYKDSFTSGAVSINPLSFAKGAAQNFFSKTQNEEDVFDYYVKWEKWAP